MINNKIMLILAIGLLLDQTASQAPAAWPATSYSPYFQSLFAMASSPVAALPSGPGAQAPAIPIPGPMPAGPVRYGFRWRKH